MKQNPYSAAFRHFLRRHSRALSAWRCILVVIGRVVFFWRKPKVKMSWVEECLDVITRGAVIGGIASRYLTSKLLPLGKHGASHSAIYVDTLENAPISVLRRIAIDNGVFVSPHFSKSALVYMLGGGWVVEAVTPTVRAVKLWDFLRHYDGFVVAVPDGCNREAVSARALSFIGRPYDVLFSEGSRWLYCHELAKLSIEAGGASVPHDGEQVLFDDIAKQCRIVLEKR